MSSSPPARRGRPPRERQHLSRERVVDTAITVAEQEGLDALTMRGVARHLGVDTMSLYNHVSDRAALLDAIAERVLAQIELPAASGDLRNDIRAAAHAFRAVAVRHPNCASLVLTRQLGSPAGLAPTDAVLGILSRAGFPPALAVHALRALLAYVVGALLRETGASPAFSGDDQAGVARRAAELTGAGLPHLADAAGELAVCEHDTEFEFGLDLLLAALERPAG